MERGSLREFYLGELKKGHNAETQLVSALPAVIQAASAEELRRTLQSHLEQTKDHATRLEMILDVMGEKPEGVKCVGMESLIAELGEIQGEGLSPEVLDLALTAYAQRVEHYEIAMYGTLRDYAGALGDQDTASQLQNTLEEEQEADRQLTIIGQAITAQVAGREVASEKIDPSFATGETSTRIKPAA